MPGAHRVRTVVNRRGAARAAGSPAEVRFIQVLRRFGVPEPERQFVVACAGGAVFVVDFAWPAKRLLVEIDGLGKRWDAAAFDEFFQRQNAILDAGWTLRRYEWRAITRRPEHTAREIAGLLL